MILSADSCLLWGTRRVAAEVDKTLNGRQKTQIHDLVEITKTCETDARGRSRHCLVDISLFSSYLASSSIGTGTRTTYVILTFIVYRSTLILDAATNNLALLINTLDLQATPMTPDMTPLRPSPLPVEEVAAEYDGNPKKKALVADSPQKKTLRSSMSSISSLRPYAQSRSAVKPKLSKPSMSNLIGQQIAPWPKGLPPLKEYPSSSVSTATPPSSTFRPTHKRTLTPAREPEPESLYQPLRPAKVRVASGTLKASYSSLSSEKQGDQQQS